MESMTRNSALIPVSSSSTTSLLSSSTAHSNNNNPFSTPLSQNAVRRHHSRSRRRGHGSPISPVHLRPVLLLHGRQVYPPVRYQWPPCREYSTSVRRYVFLVHDPNLRSRPSGPALTAASAPTSEAFPTARPPPRPSAPAGLLTALLPVLTLALARTSMSATPKTS